MKISGITLTTDQEAEFDGLVEEIQSELGDEDRARHYGEEVWLLYHKVVGDKYVALRPEDELDDDPEDADPQQLASDAMAMLPSATPSAYDRYRADLVEGFCSTISATRTAGRAVASVTRMRAFVAPSKTLR